MMVKQTTESFLLIDLSFLLIDEPGLLRWNMQPSGSVRSRQPSRASMACPATCQGG